MSHDDLVGSLAGHLFGPERMVWQDMQLGPHGSPRPDVFTLFKSFANPQPTSYEVKVSKSDFRADATAGKWQSYLRFSSRVYFACESGLLSKNDVPSHAGLITLKDGKWTAVKKAISQPVHMPEEVLLKLLIDGVNRVGPAPRHKTWSESATVDKIKKKFGEDVAIVLRDLRAARTEIEYSKLTADRIESDAKVRALRIREEANLSPLREELCCVLGVPADSQQYILENRIRAIKIDQQAHPAVRELTRVKGMIERLASTISVEGVQ